MEAGLNFLWMMIQTIIALAVVCGLAYLLFRVVLPKINFAASSNSMVRIIDRVPLDARKSLFVIEVADKWMLVAVSEMGVQIVSELDPKAAQLAEDELLAARGAQSGALLGAGITEKISELFKAKREKK